MEQVGPYKLEKLLGKGSFGAFYSAKDDFGQTVGVKVTSRDLDNSLKEADILEKLTYSKAFDYVPHYYDRLFVDGKLYVAIELVEGMTLTDFIKHGEGKYSTGILWPIFTQLIMGLKAIHKADVAHRDIKPDNIMITPDYKVKFIDFGLACSDFYSCNGTHGTPFYQPPEVLNRIHDQSLAGSKAQDIWSLSLVLYNLANNKLPFIDNDFDIDRNHLVEIVSEIQEVNSNYAVDDGRTDVFLTSIIEVDPLQRLTIKQLYQVYLDIILNPPFVSSG